MDGTAPAEPVTCGDCGQPVTECAAEIILGHRHPSPPQWLGCKGWAHTSGEHACPGGATVAGPAGTPPPVDATSLPDGGLERDLLHLRMIAEAQKQGLTWAQIGSAFGMSGRETKRRTHHLARKCQRQVVTRDIAAAAG